MYDGKTEHSSNVVPKEASSSECNPILDENNQGCSPSKVFQRHHSLAELSSVAVSEKIALDKSENSQNSDTSESSQSFDSEECESTSNESLNTSAIYNTIQLCHVGPSQIVQLTPTKIAEVEEGQASDPLTPTANLKMLMSVVSPAIRDREEKKKDLFYTDCEKMTEIAEEVIIEKPTIYSRKDKSLGLLCQRFLAKFPENPGENGIEICLDEVSKDLMVERRRVYDIVNVLESVEVLSRVAKNRYLWHGKTRISHTLGRLKALSKSQESVATSSRKVKGKPGRPSTSKAKMKRYFSSGDVPKQNKTSGTFGESSTLTNKLAKHEERLRIKAAIDSTDRCRKDKSLGVLSQKFLMMFLLSKDGVVTLEDAANVLLDEHDVGNVKYKTKVRRLYDIANILSSLKLIEKVHIRGASGKKPGFTWIGIDIESLPLNTMPTSPAQTSKTKHSLLPDSTSFSVAKRSILGSKKQHVILPALKNDNAPNTNYIGSSNKNPTTPYVRWTKSLSCYASIAGYSNTIKEEKPSIETGTTDGFLVHEFASSPVNVPGRDMPLYSPTDVTFREEIQKLQQKFPNRMSQLLAVLPFNSSQTSTNKSSRRNLFTHSNSNTQNPTTQVTEPNLKRARKNSIGDFKATGDNSCAQVNTETSRIKDCHLSHDENDDPEKNDNQTKFIHSTNSPFKIMFSCDHNYHGAQVLDERRKQEALFQEQHQIYQRTESQWHQHMAGQLKNLESGSSPKMVQLVDQAVSPIPPSKLVPRASIAIQTSLIKDISPLKPLVFLQHVTSPWNQPAVTPSSVPPAPPSTPELPNELAVGAFQSQANKLYLRSVSPYPVSGSQSCSSSPGATFCGAKLFFPPSPTPATSTINSLVLPQAGQFYTFNHVIQATQGNMISPPTHHHSNSCPASVNPSPTPLDRGLPFSSGMVVPGRQTPSPNTSAEIIIPLLIPQEIPEQLLNRSGISTPSPLTVNFTPCQYKQQPPAGSSTLLNSCKIVSQAGGLVETPSSNMAETLINNTSRKLNLTNEESCL